LLDDPAEVKRREAIRESMLESLLDKEHFERKDHKTIAEYRDRIPTLKLLPKKPVYTNLVGAREDVAAIELFGTLPGVFTGVDFRLGRVAEAQQSMLFIDELGYVPKPVQAHLLTTIQERRVLPAGGLKGHEIKDLDVWYIAALTPPYNSILPELFYRLGSFVIELRSLDNIKSEFPKLMDTLVDLYLKREHVKASHEAVPNASPRSMSLGAKARLQNMRWPGNLR
jgi:sigma-54 dependent transcriptional regulator, acetoin dehydrogenase operon transcriptional activator AcoR